MITVACVLKSGHWAPSKTAGGYKPEHVERLRKQVAEHLTLPHRFVCLTDVAVSCESIPLLHAWPGWWSKLELFRPGIGLDTGPVLYLDLDTSVVGNIDHMVQHEAFTVLMNLSSRKHDRIGSGLMFWNEDASYLYRAFATNPIKYMNEYVVGHRWGDQGFLQEHLKSWAFWQVLFPDQVRSFKLDPPHGEDRIICFNGKPKPWEVQNG